MTIALREVMLYGFKITLDSEGENFPGQRGLEIAVPDIGDAYGPTVLLVPAEVINAEDIVNDEPRSYAYALGALQFRNLVFENVVQRPN